MSGSDDRVRTARSLLLRAVESLGNGSTRPLETNSENTNPRLQLANQDASGGRGVQREPAYESAAISTPTSEATTSAVAERNRLFNFGFRRSSGKRSKYASSVPKTKKKRLGTWSHDFVCLWCTTTATKPPSCLKIADLIRAGLGRKQITLIDGDGSHELHREILHTFPRLSEGGGYELLRVAESGQRNLCVIPSPSDGYSVSYLREVLRQAKVYIRPVQNDLSLDPRDNAADPVRCVCSV